MNRSKPTDMSKADNSAGASIDAEVCRVDVVEGAHESAHRFLLDDIHQSCQSRTIQKL